MANQAPSSRDFDQPEAPDRGSLLASWDFSEYEIYERGRWWYIIGTLFVITMLVYSYIDQNPLLGIIVVLAAVIFMISERRGPEYHTIDIMEDGVGVGPSFYTYGDLKNFFIIYQPPEVKTLYIVPHSLLRPRLAIPLESQDPMAIRSLLIQYLPEDLEREHEPASDSWGRVFKL